MNDRPTRGDGTLPVVSTGSTNEVDSNTLPANCAADEMVVAEANHGKTENDMTNSAPLKSSLETSLAQSESASLVSREGNVELVTRLEINETSRQPSLMDLSTAISQSDPDDGVELKRALEPLPNVDVPSFPPTTDDGEDQPQLVLSSSSQIRTDGEASNMVADATYKDLLSNGFSPHRASSTVSRVSSIGSTMNCSQAAGTGDSIDAIVNLNRLNDADDEAEDDAMEETTAGEAVAKTDVVFDPVVLFGLKGSTAVMPTSDDKSVRSESTRPDPPSIIDGQSPRNDESTFMATAAAVSENIKERNENGVVIPIDVPETLETAVHDVYSNGLDGTQSQGSTGAVIENTLTLTRSDTESTVVRSHQAPNNSDSNQNGTTASHTWDLDRTALLATTPEIETKWMSAPSSSNTVDTAAIPTAPHLFDGMNQNGSLDVSQDTEDGALQEDLMPRQMAGPDNLVVLPRVDEHRFYGAPQPSSTAVTASSSQLPSQMIQTHPLPPSLPFANMQQQQHQQQAHGSFNYVQSVPPQQPSMMMAMSSNGGRRKIRLRLQEEVRSSNNSIKRHFRSSSLFGSLRKSSNRMLRFGGSYTGSSVDMRDEVEAMPELYKTVDRGSLTVSWYEGTSSLELQQHVRKSVTRKLKLENSSVELEDFRVLDDAVDPPEEIVLAPYMPDGAQFLLRFTTTNSSTKTAIRETDGSMTPLSQYSGRAPISPSAAPSPHPDRDIFSRLNANQLALLNALDVPTERSPAKRTKKNRIDVKQSDAAVAAAETTTDASSHLPGRDLTHPLLREASTISVNEDNAMQELAAAITNGGTMGEKSEGPNADDPIESRLREITELLLSDRKKSRSRQQERQGEKRQVIFIVANYFVLFLAIIAISAELQAKAPTWLKMMEDHLQSVQNCSENQEALLECVSRGDFAGLIASVLLWLSRSVATKRIFLFGFDSPKKLWTVVYESFITSICWGVSYLFIRRGMNSDTRPRFVQKYWKDAVYGSLAGFNAAFLKHVLKNLIPEDVVEGALRDRQQRIFGWLHNFE